MHFGNPVKEKSACLFCLSCPLPFAITGIFISGGLLKRELITQLHLSA